MTHMTKRSIIFWNVQRLFDSRGSPIEYVLSAEPASEEFVQGKIRIISAVLDAISAIAGLPLVVGLAEIENALLSQEIAKGVGSVTLDSVDVIATDDTGFALDGLNLGLLVDSGNLDEIERLRSHVIDRTFMTRDILECDMVLKDGKKLSVLLNHWPSRMIGEAEGRRITAAHYLRNLVKAKSRFTLSEMWDAASRSINLPSRDAIEQRAITPVITMGDFNDEVFDTSIELLGSTDDMDAVLNDLDIKQGSRQEEFRSYMASPPLLFNPFWSLVGKQGSYYRTPRWRGYDQILLSQGCLMPEAFLRYLDDSVGVFARKEVYLPDGSTFALTNRNGKPVSYDHQEHRGCSDHFPVFVSIDV